MKTLQQLTDKNRESLQEFEGVLDYTFKDISLLQQALIHSSFGFERVEEGHNNETLEFLGDAVLDLAVSEILFKTYPGVTEGELTKMRAGLVKEATLAEMGRNIALGDFLKLGKGEDASRGREKSSILACAFEALVGAMFLDNGYVKAFQFINTHFAILLPARMESILVEDAKSLLQEKIQEQFNQVPTYHLVEESGPAHAKKFTVSARFGGLVLGAGVGSSKKVAERKAAENALDTIDSWWSQLKKE